MNQPRDNRIRWAAVVCAVLGVCLRPGGGQAATEPLQTADYVIHNWRAPQGLPDDAVTAINLTPDGYLWVGTANGLARFDGLRFAAFRSGSTVGLPDGGVLNLFADAESNLWVGTEGGLVRYRDGRFSVFTTKQGLSSDRILCVKEDGHHQLWAGTVTGLNRWDQPRFNSFFSLEGPPGNRINDMAPLPDGKLVLATDTGLAEFGGIRYGGYDPVPGMPGGAVYHLLADSRGDLWMAGEAGLYRIRRAGPDQGVVQVSTGLVTTLANGGADEIWVGTAAGDLQQVPLKTGKPAPVEITRFPSAITALHTDDEHDLWVGTAGNGLFRLKRRQLRLIKNPTAVAGQTVTALLIRPGGEIWMVPAVGPLLCRRAGEVAPFRAAGFPKDNQVRTLAENPDSGVWMGTLEDGLFNWDRNQLRHWNELDGLSDNDIEALCAGTNGEVWVGTRNGGLNRLQAGRITRFLTPWGYTGGYARVIAQDRSGRVWIGTQGDGLFSLREGKFESFTTQNGLPDNHVQALLLDADGVLWIGTAGGLARLKNQELTKFTELDGLPDQDICQIQDDGLGNLWVGSESGIYRLRKSELRGGREGRPRFLNAVTYGESDGLPPLQCIPGAQAISSDPPGESLWFSTSQGLVHGQPDLLRWNRRPPPVVLEQVLVDNSAVPLTDPIQVSPGKGTIEFSYTGLSLPAAEKVRFRCQLVNFDAAEVDMGEKRAARYTLVPPGRYHFQVRACNNDGVWSQTGAGIGVVVEPFWWQTTGFRLAVGAGAGALIFLLVHQRRVRLRELERLRIRLAGDLHDELGSSLWSINLLSQSLQKYGRLGDEERQDVGQIHRIARQTSNAIRDIVWIINPAFDTTGDLVLRMKDFAGTILRGTEYQVQCHGADLSRSLPLDFRQNFFLMFKEVLTNVAKHAAATSVEIRLQEETEVWMLCVRDNGVGFDPHLPAKGNGMASLRGRAEKMGARILIDSHPGQGATVKILFKIPRPLRFWPRMFFWMRHRAHN